MPRQAVPDYKVVLIRHGCRAFYYRRATHIADAGSLVVVHPGEVNGSAAIGSETADVDILCVSPSLLTAATGGPPFLNAFSMYDRRLAAQFFRLCAALEGPAASHLERAGRRADFLCALRGRRGCAPPTGFPTGVMPRAREFLEDNYAEDDSLEHLARLVGLSPSYFCRAFRRHFGVPPHAYQTGTRIARAKPLLAAGRPIGEIALLTGFFDQAHFTHAFRRYAGTTPARYACPGQEFTRRAARAGP